MSSYSLERLATVRFNRAVMLNLSADHLDRHGDMAGYAAAKANIFARQTGEDVAVLGQDDAMTAAMGSASPPGWCRSPAARARPGGIWAEGHEAARRGGRDRGAGRGPCPPGVHNAQNAAAAAAVALSLGVGRDILAAGLRSFGGLPHRQERVGTIGGVAFVNDSKATNADSTARALASYERVVWIAAASGRRAGFLRSFPCSHALRKRS
jgi:UDP-N-acetylmuramoylalanine--D-glutamate ligase